MPHSRPRLEHRTSPLSQHAQIAKPVLQVWRLKRGRVFSMLNRARNMGYNRHERPCSDMIVDLYRCLVTFYSYCRVLRVWLSLMVSYLRKPSNRISYCLSSRRARSNPSSGTVSWFCCRWADIRTWLMSPRSWGQPTSWSLTLPPIAWDNSRHSFGSDERG